MNLQPTSLKLEDFAKAMFYYLHAAAEGNYTVSHKTRGQSNLAKVPGCHWLTAECRVQTACAATGSNRDYNSLAIAPKIVMLMSDDR